MLLDAAKSSRGATGADGDDDDNDDDNDTEVEEQGQDDVYEIENLQDARDRSEEEQDIQVNTFTLDNDDAEEDPVVALAASSRSLLEYLVGSSAKDARAEHCPACLDDNTAEPDKKERKYLPGQLKQHLISEYHSPRSKFARKYPDNSLCPFGCGKTFKKSKEIIYHAWDQLNQTDEHLLKAARAGLFNSDFDPREGRTAAVVVNTVGGVVQVAQAADPDTVPINAVLPPGNIDPHGNVTARTASYPGNSPVLRLPTLSRLTQSAWWKEHQTGLYGHVADALQAQQRCIANLLDNNLRAQGHGQADATGATRNRAYTKLRKREHRAVLRKRLREELNWSWAADDDDAEEEQ